MKFAVLLAVLGLAAPVDAPPLAATQIAALAAGCEPQGELHYICGPVNAEDLLPVAGGRYLVAGSYKPGPAGFYLIDTAAKTYRVAALSLAAKPAMGDPACPAPDLTILSTHGLDVKPGKDGRTTVYAVNHRPGGDAVEIFSIDPVAGTAAWTGCVMMPAGTSANSVAALPDGSIVVTQLFDTRERGSGISPVLQGKVTGLVYRWIPSRGISVVAGSQLSGDNGLVASADGATLFVNAYGTKEVWRLPASGAGERVSAKVPFNPDNLRWAPDGQLFVTGQYLDPARLGGPNDWGVVKLDPATMAVTPILRQPGTREFDNGTTAVQVGKTLFFGTFKGDRIAWRTLP